MVKKNDSETDMRN